VDDDASSISAVFSLVLGDEVGGSSTRPDLGTLGVGRDKPLVGVKSLEFVENRHQVVGEGEELSHRSFHHKRLVHSCLLTGDQGSVKMMPMTRPDFTLTVNCPDEKGIIAAVTQTIAAGGGNILNLSQHTAVDIDTFLLKADFSVDETFGRQAFEKAFTVIADRFQMIWRLHDKAVRPRVAILVSKTSHCLYELLLKHQDGELECDFPVIIANHPDLASVATQFHIPFFQVDPAKGKPPYEADIQRILEDWKIDTVVLARYMQILSPEFTRRWAYQIINIHHGFLPAFMGAKPYHQAWHRGVKIIGATAHFANENLDQGPIISQDTIQVPDTCSIAEFVQMGKDVERKVLFEALRCFLNREVFVYGGRTFLLP